MDWATETDYTVHGIDGDAHEAARAAGIEAMTLFQLLTIYSVCAVGAVIGGGIGVWAGVLFCKHMGWN